MKRFLLFFIPFLVAFLIFFGILYFLDKNSGKGALQVTSMPKTSIYLDGKLIGITPFCTCDLDQRLPIGDYTVKLIPIEGNFKEYQEKIAINKGTLTVLDRTFSDNGSSDGSIVSLIPLGDKNNIEIMVTSIPQKANVFLDNNPVGITPLLLKNISESNHDLRITHEGYKDISVKIKTAFGFRLNSTIFLGINPDLLNPPAASSSATPTPIATISKVLILDTPTGFLRVRESSSTSSSEIARVNPGEIYDLILEEEGWFQIKINLPNGESKLGWISSSYSSKQEELGTY